MSRCANLYLFKTVFSRKSFALFGFYFLFSLGSLAALDGRIKVVCTSALIKIKYEMRQQEYRKALQILNGYGIIPYIAEAYQEASPSFLENYTPYVLYTNVNDARLRNKGVNEARSLIELFKYYDFDDEDMIVKMTGRYHFTSPYFLDYIDNHPDVDAFALKTNPDIAVVCTGCYAIRCKYFKEMLHGFDLSKMEEELIDIERATGVFLEQLAKRGKRVEYMDKLDVRANIFYLDYTWMNIDLDYPNLHIQEIVYY